MSREQWMGRSLLLGWCLLAGACSGKSAEVSQRPAAVRARESTLAKAGLPGASGIGGALRASDSADARRRLEDSLARAAP